MKKFCIRCGQEHDGVDIVCEQCKATEEKNLSPDVQQANESNMSNKSSLSTGTIIAIIVVILAICFGYIVDGGNSKSKIKDLTSSPYLTTGVTLVNYHVDSSYVKGTITANVGKGSSLAIEIAFFDKNKSILDTYYDYSPPLDEGQSWSFSVLAPVDSAYYKIKRIVPIY
ncbi:MAG: FxLYD domain-containing protein [Oscillospiraceae bacterium]|nr:FxLYD domain-containing protein [Oscillospiraceae bacterium]MBR4201889.1 FxLYD domain-containing protein [Oscillospiraceae bacterium]MBR6716756.1 FxLYD domain-containing protein [Oscillospiraceae bacterium]